MTEFLLSQMDYVFLSYGLAFIILAAACLGRPNRNDVMPWTWLGLFALIHGLNEWLDLLAISLGDSFWFASMRLALMGLSFAMLVEFARRGMPAASRRRLGLWVHLPLLGLVALGSLHGQLLGANVSCRYSLGLVGAAGSAVALWLAADNLRGQGRLSLRLCSACLGLYALAAGAVTPASDLLLSAIVNHTTFLQVMGFPVQLLRAMLAIGATLAYWGYCRSIATVSVSPVASSRWATWMPAIVTVLLAVGWVVTQNTGQREDSRMREYVLQRALTAAASFDSRTLDRLECTEADANNEDYQTLKRQLAAVRSANPDTRFAYLTRLVDGSVRFLVDGEPEDSEDLSRPGSVYAEASPQFVASFDNGQGFVEGPLPDEFGVWVSGMAPIRDESNAVVALLGLDIAASDWARQVALARLAPIGITILLCLLLLGFFAAASRLKESTEQVVHSQRQYRSLVEGSPDAVQLFDDGARCLAVNGTGLSSMGYREQDILGLRFAELWPPDVRPLVEEAVAKVLAGKKQTFEARFVVPGGAQQIRFVALTPVVEDSGRIHQFVSVSRDITARKRDEQALNAMKEDCERCLAAGMDAYLSKPISGDRIAAAIAQVVDPGTPTKAAPAGPQPPVSQPSEPAAPAEASRPIDYAALLHRCMNKPDFVQRVLAKFVQSTQETLRSLEEALVAGDADTAARNAHSIKGASASVAAEAVRAAAAEMERLIKAGADAAAMTVLPKLKLELARCLQQARGMLDKAPNGQT